MDKFIKNYWNYYIELESQLLELKRYVEFDKKNFQTYSIEILKLFQTVCSEIDAAGKEIALSFDEKFKPKDANIKKWGYIIQQNLKGIKNIKIIFNENIELCPYKNWEYIELISKKGKPYLKKAKDIDMIIWWKHYNSIKHERVGWVENETNYHLANLKNLLNAFCALFILETMYINSFCNEKKITESKLFKYIE